MDIAIHKELEALSVELQTLKAAVKHIDDAKKAAAAASNMLKSYEKISETHGRLADNAET